MSPNPREMQRTSGGAYHTVRTAAAQHCCRGCLRPISPGATYTESVVFPGSELADLIGVKSRPSRARYCTHCEPIPYSDPRLTGHEIPIPGT